MRTGASRPPDSGGPLPASRAARTVPDAAAARLEARVPDSISKPMPAWRAVMAFALVALPATAFVTYALTARRSAGPARPQPVEAIDAAAGEAPAAALADHRRLRADLAKVTTERDSLFTETVTLRRQMQELKDSVIPNTEALVLGASIAVSVDGADCTVQFVQPAPGAPYLEIQADVRNSGTGDLPGILRIALYDGFCAQVAETYLNLFGEGGSGVIRPGEHRSMRGSVRLSGAVPKRFLVRLAS